MYLFKRTIGSGDNCLYILRPVITNHLFDKFVSFFHAAPDSEYKKLVLRISNLLFFCGENLTSLYDDLYSVEYKNFSDFLEFEINFDDESIKDIIKNTKANECLWRININGYETYNFLTLFDTQMWEKESIFDEIKNAVARCDE